MKELYNAPELEIVTFVPMEQLAAGYLSGYAKLIGADDDVIDIPLSGEDPFS